jgi:hypothetical protein
MMNRLTLLLCVALTAFSQDFRAVITGNVSDSTRQGWPRI